MTIKSSSSKFKTMKSIFEYQDYRKYMQDFYDYKKRTVTFSWREFSKLAGFVSPNYLKQVCEREANLSTNGITQVAKAMELTELETTFFKDLVVLDQAKDDAQKKEAFAEIETIANANKVQVIGADTFKFYESWLHPVVRELAPAMPGALPKQIAQICRPKSTAMEVKESIQFLEQVKLLEKTDSHSYRQTTKKLLAPAATMGLAIRSMNRQMGNFAISAIDDVPVSERNITGITMGISEDSYEKIVETLRECQNKIVDIVSNDSKKINRVYRLNFQLFPLSERIQEASNENED